MEKSHKDHKNNEQASLTHNKRNNSNIRDSNNENKKEISTLKSILLIVLGVVIVNIILTGSILLLGGSGTLNSDLSNINEKVDRIDNFFSNNIEEYGAGSANAQAQTQNSQDSAQPEKIDVSVDDDPMLGNPDAKVTVIEFSDYQCPFCRRYWTESYPQLKEEYIDTGKIKYVFRDFPLDFHKGAIPAAVAANCVREQQGDEAYFEFHDIVFREQNKQGQGTIQFGEEDVMSWVNQISGLNMDEFTTCYNDPAQEQEVQDDFRAGQQAGVSGTPTFFINGVQLTGAQPYSVIKAEIEKALNE